MRWDALATLLLTSLAIMGSPGPATISLTAAGAAYGVERSLGYLAGIVAGTTVVLVAVATGITAALLAVPWARPLLLAVSAVYIVRLAYGIATAPPLPTPGCGMDAPTCAGGALLGVANPKAWVAIAAVFASARLASSPAADAAGKVGALALMIVLINTVWLVAGASLAPALREPRRARALNRTLAVTLVAATVLALVHAPV